MINYEKQAEEFLRDTKTRMSIKYETTVEGFPNSDDKLLHDKYKVTMSRVTAEGKRRSFTFPFYGSYHDHVNHKVPTPYSILACLQAYEPEKDMLEFANEYGYLIDNEKQYHNLKRIYAGVCREYKGLKRLFTDEQLERLVMIT